MAFENPFTAVKNMPKPARYAVIAGTAGVTGYFLYQHHKNTGTWNPWGKGTKVTSAGNAADINPVTGLAYSQDSAIDPITGLSYLAESEQYGSVQAAEASVSAYGLSTASGSGIPVNPASPPPAGSPNTTVGGSVYTSDSAWAQAATAGLADIGYNATDVATALGAYLTGTPVTQAQAKLINTAIAEFGPPPVGSFQVIIIPGPPPPPPPPPSNKPSVSGGHVISAAATRAEVGWTGHNAVRYQVRITGPGKINGKTNTIPGTTASFSGLESHHNYTVYITPFNSAGNAGPAGHIDFQTT
jgi:hypothetical protein